MSVAAIVWAAPWPFPPIESKALPRPPTTLPGSGCATCNVIRLDCGQQNRRLPRLLLLFRQHGLRDRRHGRSPRSYFRGRGYARSYRPAIVVAPYYRYYPSPVYDPYYYAPAPYYDPYYAPYGYGYSSYRYSPYRRAYGYGYRHFYGGAAFYLPHVRIGIGW